MDIEEQIKNDPLFQAQRELLSELTDTEEEELDINDVTKFMLFQFDPSDLIVVRDIKRLEKKESAYDFQI